MGEREHTSPRSAISVATPPNTTRESAVSGSWCPSRSIQRALGRSSSGAPLTKRTTSFGPRCTVTRRFTLGLEGDLVYAIENAGAACRLSDPDKLHRIANPFGAGAVAGQLQVMTVLGAFEKSSMRCRKHGTRGIGDRDKPVRDVDRSHSIRFCVSVPVLSVQITVADPSVSTLGR